MAEIGQPVIASDIAETVDQAMAVAEKIGYPVIVRPAFTLGGAGGGAGAVNTFTVFGFFLYDIIRNSFNIMNQGFGSGFKSGVGYFDKNLVADCSDRCAIISHMYISFYRIAVIQLTVLHGKTE